MKAYFTKTVEGLTLLVVKAPDSKFLEPAPDTVIQLGITPDEVVHPQALYALRVSGGNDNTPVILEGMPTKSNLEPSAYDTAFHAAGFGEDQNVAGFDLNVNTDVDKINKFLTLQFSRVLDDYTIASLRKIATGLDTSYAEAVYKSTAPNFTKFGWWLGWHSEWFLGKFITAIAQVKQSDNADDKAYATRLSDLINKTALITSSKLYVPDAIWERFDSIVSDEGDLLDSYLKYYLAMCKYSLQPRTKDYSLPSIDKVIVKAKEL